MMLIMLIMIIIMNMPAGANLQGRVKECRSAEFTAVG